MPKSSVDCYTIEQVYTAFSDNAIPVLHGSLFLEIDSKKTISIAEGSPSIHIRGRGQAYIFCLNKSTPKISSFDRTAPVIEVFDDSQPLIVTHDGSRPRVRYSSTKPPKICKMGSKDAIVFSESPEVPVKEKSALDLLLEDPI